MPKLATITARYRDDLERIAKDSSLDLSNRVHDGTPVDTGRARGGWSASGGFAPGQVYQYLNNVEYIRVLEYGHHSQQAPNGMLRINVRNWQAIVDQHAR